jgi:branched-chain amino acid transport system ATP-binding protein
LLIEHNMDVVMQLAHRITVMNQGAILADGTPAEIRASAAVQRAYLGA